METKKKNKIWIIVAIVAVVAVIAYLLFTRAGGVGVSSGDKTGYGALAQMFGDATATINDSLARINKSFEGYQQNKYNYELNKSQQVLDQINYNHATNQMYVRKF